MNRVVDIQPDIGECPYCGNDIGFFFFHHEWKEQGKIDSNNTLDTEETESFIFECPCCNMVMKDINTFGDAQDFFMGINKEYV